MAEEQPSLSDLLRRMDQMDERQERIEATVQEIHDLVQPVDDDEKKIDEVIAMLNGLAGANEKERNALDQVLQRLWDHRGTLRRIESGVAKLDPNPPKPGPAPAEDPTETSEESPSR